MIRILTLALACVWFWPSDTLAHGTKFDCCSSLPVSWPPSPPPNRVIPLEPIPTGGGGTDRATPPYDDDGGNNY